MVLNGLIRVSALTRRESGSRDNADTSMVTAYFQPGTLSSSLLIAADLNETSFVSGHWTEFPSNEPTVLVQIPFFDNQVPQHEVLHEGPCGIF